MFEEFILNMLTHLPHMTILSIVHKAIPKRKLHIIKELLQMLIFMRYQIIPYRSKIHRILYDIEVIVDLQLLRVDWLMENARLVHLPQRIEESSRCFVP